MKPMYLFIYLIILIFVTSNPIIAQKFSKYFTTENLDTIKRKRNTQYYNYVDIGEIESANRIQGEHANSQFEHALNNYDISYVKELESLNAVDHIQELSKEEQIIIINEMHHTAQHRVFTKQLLQGLWDTGYRYFGMEALVNDPYMDSMLNRNQYPIQIENIPISYVQEPQFGELIREAFRIGFTIFPYEINRAQRELRKQKKSDRELAQAKNIMKILDEDPQAKILIHCGYAHAVESVQAATHNWGKTKWMANILNEYSGINPLTIDQTILTERTPFPNNPFYYTKEVDSATLFRDPYNFNFRPNTFFAIDLYVWHPKTKLIFGRPHWLVNQTGYIAIGLSMIELEELNYPFLVFAQYANEPEIATPSDVFEVKSPKEFLEKKLVLRQGFSYRIYTKDKAGLVRHWDGLRIDE